MRTKNRELLTAAAQLLAYAIHDLLPASKVLDARLTPLGYCVVFTHDSPFDGVLLTLLEEKMRVLFKQDLTLEPLSMMRENAANLFSHHQQEFLSSAVMASSRNIVSVIRTGTRYGLGHLDRSVHVSNLGVPKLLDYRLTRSSTDDQACVSVEGILCPDTRSLKKFIKFRKSLQESDPIALGCELGLFLPAQDTGIEECVWLPKGEALKNALMEWWKNAHQKAGFSLISTFRWKQASSPEASVFTTPAGVQLEYLSDHKELVPQLDRLYQATQSERFAEIQQAFPREISYDPGLFESSVYTRDAAFILADRQGIEKELISSLQFLKESIKMFSINCQWALVVQKLSPAGSRTFKDTVQSLLAAVLEQSGIQYTLEEDDRNPRIEARFVDLLEREWPGPQVECVPLSKIPASSCSRPSGTQRHSTMIVRTFFGSLERFIALLVERYAGLFPVWLAPEQVRVIPVKRAHLEYAQSVYNRLLAEGVRANIDLADQKLATKIFAVKSARVPYALVIGDVEQKNGTIAVCPWGNQGEGAIENLSIFLVRLKNEIDAKQPLPIPQGPRME